MCGPLLWGFWWIFPVMGLLMCLGFMAFHFESRRRGFKWMGERGGNAE